MPGVSNATMGTVNVTATNMEGGKSYYVVLGFQGVVQQLAKWEKPTEGEGEFKTKFVHFTHLLILIISTRVNYHS